MSLLKVLSEIPEINVSKTTSLQMPLIEDPGKSDDNFVPNEKLDFSVRLGSSLSRGHNADDKRVRKQLELTLQPGPNEDLTSPTGSFRSSPSPRDSGKEFTPRIGSKNARSRRESRRASRERSSVVENTYIAESALQRFHRILKTVRIISGVCLALKRYVQECQTKSWSFMEMYLHVKEDLNQVVAFNPHNFARVEPERGKLKKLLDIPGHKRTAMDVKVILALLRDNKSFQEYPSHVQLQLSRCMTYQSYEARRVVLKQGHRPDAFYILLSGHVIANIEDKNPQTGKLFIRTVTEMGPGDTFGEIALIEGGRRTATIVCKTNVELLVILQDDFDAIIRAPLMRQIEEHVNFCRNMPLFRDFPCDKLSGNPSQFFYHYFKKGDVVVRNSKESKHIIAIKVGKCKVISSYVEAVRSRRKPHSADVKHDLDTAFPNYEHMQKITALHRKPKSEAEKMKETICLGLLTGTIDRTRLADHGPDVTQRPKSSMYPEERRQPPPLHKSKTLSEFFQTTEKQRKDAVQTLDELNTNVHDSFWGSRLRYIPKTKRVGTAKSVSQYSVSGRSSRVLPSRLRNPFYTTERNTHAQIAELQAGTVFGLESLVQKPTTTLSLVSEGSECIFISKRLFLNYANIKVLRIVTDMVQTYPSQDFIEEQVRHHRNWQKYKATLVQGVLGRHK